MFFCQICGTKYSRKEFYERHLDTDLHKSKAENKSSSSSKDKKNHNTERKENELTEWENKRLKIENFSKEAEFGSTLSDASESCSENQCEHNINSTDEKEDLSLHESKREKER